MSRRFILAWTLVDKKFKTQLDDLKSMIDQPLYNHHYEGRLFGFQGNPIYHIISTDILYVRNNFVYHTLMEKLHLRKQFAIYPEKCSIYESDSKLINEKLLLDKVGGFACYAICSVCFDNDVDSIIYGRN